MRKLTEVIGILNNTVSNQSDEIQRLKIEKFNYENTIETLQSNNRMYKDSLDDAQKQIKELKRQLSETTVKDEFICPNLTDLENKMKIYVDNQKYGRE